MHLLAAFSDALGGVIGQLQLAPDGNEIAAALELLKTLPLAGSVVTGDAIFTQKEICRVIRDRGGDCFFTVKDHQPKLKSDIALDFGDVVIAARYDVRQDGRQRAWPHRDTNVADDIKPRGLSRSGLTGRGASLPHHPSPLGAWQGKRRDGPCDHGLTAQQADAARLLALSRSHWGIEKRLHYVRDVIWREDQCRTRARAAHRSWPPSGTPP